jgi:O-antigen/teichoic acid export membrane protein
VTEFRKFYRDSSILAVGEGVAAVASLGALALAARRLGADEFGQLAMIMAFAMVLDLVFNLQSARLVVRYGAAPLAAGDRGELSGLLKLCLLLDLAGAGAAWMTGMVLSVAVASEHLGLPESVLQIYLLTALTNVTGHAYGFLRLTGHFGWLALQRALASVMRLVGVLVLMFTSRGGLVDVVWVLVAAEVLGRVLLLGLCMVAAGGHGVHGFLKAALPRVRRLYPDILSFTGLANLGDSVLKVAQQLDVFIVAALMSPAEAGQFRAVKSLGSVPQLIGSAASQVLYPAVARWNAEGGEVLRRFIRPVWLSLAGIAIAGLCAYVLLSPWLVPFLFGDGFQAAVVPSVVYMAGAAIGLALMPITPMVLVRGRQGQLFVSYSGAACAYVVVVYGGGTIAGLPGVAAGFAALYITYGAISALLWSTGGKER